MNGKITKINFEGDTYYLYDGNIVDSCFTTLHDSLLRKVANYYFSKADYKSMSFEELKDFVKITKQNQAFQISYEAVQYALQNADNDTNVIKYFLPVLSSLCRKLGKPELAIEQSEKYLNGFDNVISIPLLTSLASCYCDVKNYKKALDLCNAAYAKQGGGLGYKSELSLVYARIRKESDLFDED